MALTAELAAVVVKRSDPGESGGLGLREGAELGHEREERGGGEGADALDLAEPIDLGLKFRTLGDLCLHECLELVGLFLEEGDGFGDEAEQLFVCEGASEVIVLRDLGEEMGAVLDQGGELLLTRIWRRERLRLKGLSEVRDQLGIDPIGLGETVFRPREIADLPGVELNDGTAGGVGEREEQSLITAARFADQDRLWRKRCEPGSDGLLGVGKAM